MFKFNKVESLKVYMEDKEVGTLAMRPDNLCAFEYSAEWLRGGFSISPVFLPLQSGVFTSKYDPFEGLFGVFNDSLPDGWGRLLIDRLLRKHQINPAELTPLDRLTIIGKNGMGALSYKPVNIVTESKDISDLEYLEKEAEKVLHDDYSGDLDILVKKGGSSGGARPKVFIKDGGAEWLVKFRNSQDPKDIGEIEYKYSLAAKAAGLEMAETKLFNGKYFGVKRFDRKGGRHVHMHTAAGLLHADFRLPALDYKNLIEAALFLTRSEAEAEKIYRLMAFNVLTHNRDDHAKNFSFIYDEGRWQFSPAYDLVYSEGFNGQHTTTVLGNGNPAKEDMLNLAKETCINAKRAKEILAEVESGAEQLKPLIKRLG